MKGEIHSAICSCGMGMAKKFTKFMFVLTVGCISALQNYFAGVSYF
jgi:hypothetical protein